MNYNASDHDNDQENESTNDWSDELFEKGSSFKEFQEEDFDALTDEVKDEQDINTEERSINNFDDHENIVDTGSIDEYRKERTSDVTGKTVINYVDNDTFCNAVIAWNEKRTIALEKGLPTPSMPNVIGDQILKIAEGLARRNNFRNYTYIDEMKEDAIYMAVRAVKNFDPTKSSNAFGYFNFVMWRAMTTRIKAEKKENEIKMNLLKDPMYLGYTSETGGNDGNIDKDRIISIYEQ